MIISLTVSFLMLSVLMTLSASSPLTLGCSILLLTLFLCCLMSFFSYSWFALLLFLIYIGGLLVMFAYFVALSPNQYHLFLFPPTLMLILLSALTFLAQMTFPLFSLSTTAPQAAASIPTLFLPENLFTLIFAALTLFITLLAAVKIVALPSGPLRPFTKMQPFMT